MFQAVDAFRRQDKSFLTSYVKTYRVKSSDIFNTPTPKRGTKISGSHRRSAMAAKKTAKACAGKKPVAKKPAKKVAKK